MRCSAEYPKLRLGRRRCEFPSELLLRVLVGVRVGRRARWRSITHTFSIDASTFVGVIALVRTAV